MPAIIAHRMTPRQAIEAALADGILTLDSLSPPLDSTARQVFSAQLARPLPPEIEDLLALCGGVSRSPALSEGALDFTGAIGRERSDAFADALREMGRTDGAAMLRDQDIFADERIGRSICLGYDECGDCWSVEIGADGSWGPVWYLCHDPPVSAIAAESLGKFLSEGLTGNQVRVSGLWPTVM